jgi:hypothetical protein
VPGQHDIGLIEHAVARHVGLAAHGLLGGRAEKDDGALELAGGDQLLDRERRAEAAGAKQVVPTAVAGGALDQRALLGDRLLRDAGSASYSPMMPTTGRPVP